MFYLGGLVFDDEGSLRHLENFALIVLAYLSFTAIACLLDFRSLVFPRFILDESIGLTPDRARGPFLQAVANGMSINLLGLIALDAYRRRRFRGFWGVVQLVALPIAILATKTRAVWFSYAVSLVALSLRSPSARIRRLCAGMVFAGIFAVAFVAMSSVGSNGVLKERLEDRNTVDFRMAAYRAGWEMFLERPRTGWGTHQIRAELSDRIAGFQGDVFVVHNTYFEVALEHGLLGLALYVWIIFELFRLGRPPRTSHGHECLLSAASWPLWPLLLSVYFVNATFVVMNYQFVNGLLFTFAGVVARQRSRSDPYPDHSSC